MSTSGGNTINEIYRSVISDVINQVKEAFLDENVDVDVLAQLKKEWEDKVNSSGCVELENVVRQPQVAPPPMRVNQPLQRMPVQPNPIRVPVGQPQMMGGPSHMQDQRLQMQYTQQPQQPQMVFQQQNLAQQQLGQLRMLPQMPGQPQQYVINGQPGQPSQLMIVQNGQLLNGMIQQRVIPQPQLSHQNIHQMDGGGDIDEHVDETPSSSNQSDSISGSGASKYEAMKVLTALLKSAQLDGGGGGMSDSSSDEDDVEEEDDPLRRIADRIGDGEVEDGDQIAEEEPLNSGDDQSDDEDNNILFEADNIVMCQFEKVNRARNKWKFQLKDGIMHIDNKDYCFQKCSGEAEW